MVMLDANSAPGLGSWAWITPKYKFQRMPERTDAIKNGVLEPITFVLAYPTVFF